MYIAPTTNIRLLSGVPLDSGYENSLFFSTLSDQVSYFTGKTKYNLIEQTFTRTAPGVARVNIPVNSLYDVNYMMFQNTGFGNKWFFAFVDSVEYKNNATSIVNFTIDVLQSWLFDYQPSMCFIERQHAATDTPGDNIAPEPVDPGETVYNSYSRLVDNLTNAAFILAINDVSGNNVFAGKYDGIPSGAQLWAFNSTDIDGLQSKINEYVQRPDAVTALYTVPHAILGLDVGHPVTGGEQLPSPKSGVNFRAYIPEEHRLNVTTATLSGYLPKNKKLLTYPYNYLECITGTGQSLNLRYEFFSEVPSFRIGGVITQPVCVYLKPASYKGAGITASGALSDEQLSLSGYPLGSWINDAYEAWVAQNSVPLAMNTISRVGSGFISGLSTGNPVAGLVGAGMAGIGAVTNVLGEKYQASIAADQSRGNPSSGNVNFASNTLDFFVGRRSLTAEYARMIDDFFTMFGYAQKKVDLPNIHARQRWTYIKTLGCQGSGAIPNADTKQIDDIYNKGVRFWVNPSEVGNYSLSNGLLT